jgi:hypothetical protein
MAYLLFQNFRFPQRHLVAQVAFCADVQPVVEEVWWFFSISNGSAHALLYHCGREGSRLNDFSKPLPGVFSSQPSPADAQETELLASSPLGLRREVT